MENILDKPDANNIRALEQLKYDLGVENSESEDEHSGDQCNDYDEVSMQTEQEQDLLFNDSMKVKEEMYLGNDFILPEVSQYTQPRKKEKKSKKEIEEEEREKMQ